ncbi:MAG: anhydro-N-acetylmuramic acid kinase [Litorivicinaceae bacterium]
MTGTSLDSIDLAWVLETAVGGPIEVLESLQVPLTDSVIERCQSIITGAALAAADLCQLEADYTHALQQALTTFQTRHPQMQPAVLGCHGQTLYHAPALRSSWQLLNPYPLAQQCRCPVAFDFRRQDLAAGGQGAPLAPLFHASHFARDGESVAVLNLGGLANITRLSPGAPILGFDTGPANTLLDLWTQTHFGVAYDHDGQYAARGQILPDLLQALLEDPYFSRPPPKSTGREYFNLPWLQARSPVALETLAPEDVLRTLVELTAVSAMKSLPEEPEIVLVAGGGALNPVLMAALDAHTTALVTTSAFSGIPPLEVESACFAWLGLACLDQRPMPTPSITGSTHPVVLGVLAPSC